MQRYFLDVFNGTELQRDDTGTEFEDMEQVSVEAIKLIPKVADEVLPNGEAMRFEIKVRDESGRYLFQTTLLYQSSWLEPS